jgi:hypothetical protein
VTQGVIYSMPRRDRRGDLVVLNRVDYANQLESSSPESGQCCIPGNASVPMTSGQTSELDETRASRPTLTARLLSERTGTLGETPPPEEKQHAAMAGFGLLHLDRRGNKHRARDRAPASCILAEQQRSATWGASQVRRD